MISNGGRASISKCELRGNGEEKMSGMLGQTNVELGQKE